MVRCRDEFMSNKHTLPFAYIPADGASSCDFLFAPSTYIFSLPLVATASNLNFFRLVSSNCEVCQTFCTIQPISAFILIHMSKLLYELAASN